MVWILGVQNPFGEFVVTYSKDYAVSMQLDDADAYKGSSGYKDVYKLRDIAPGKTETYVGELLVSGESETASIINRYIEREKIADSATPQRRCDRCQRQARGRRLCDREEAGQLL